MIAGNTNQRKDGELLMNNYFDFWMPIFKKQYFKYKLQSDIKAIVELEDNIWRNWRFTKEEKMEILRKIRGAK